MAIYSNKKPTYAISLSENSQAFKATKHKTSAN